MLTGNLLPRIRPLLAALAAGESLSLPWFALWRSLDWRRRDDNAYWCANRTPYGFRDHPAVCYREHRRRAGCDIHTRWPAELRGERAGCPVGEDEAEGGVLHFVAADWRRLVAKTAWYKMIETVRFADRSPAELNAFYDRDLDETGLVRAPVAAEWWAPYQGWRHWVDLAARPWFEAECRRLCRQHGAERFAGLHLWGVPEDETAACAVGALR